MKVKPSKIKFKIERSNSKPKPPKFDFSPVTTETRCCKEGHIYAKGNRLTNTCPKCNKRLYVLYRR